MNDKHIIGISCKQGEAVKIEYAEGEKMGNTWQSQIVESVKARGYVQGEMTDAQYAFSQLCKMVSEVSEYANEFDCLYPIATRELQAALHQVSVVARKYFNNPEAMGNIAIFAPRLARARQELGDVLVTVAMSASALGVDVEEIALAKASGDIKRGVNSKAKVGVESPESD